MTSKHPAQGTRDAQDVIAASMTEDELLANAKDAATKFGWLFYHTRDSRRSDEGYPDCTMIRVERHRTRLVIAELKREKGEETDVQKVWLAAFGSLGGDVEVYTWRPSTWLSGAIEAVLR